MQNDIEVAMINQSQNMRPENFICASCKNYKGGCGCEKYVFIAFEGANMASCSFYQRGIKCPHCGRIIGIKEVPIWY